MSLDGKVALITGAARGQGHAHAMTLAANGADFIAIDICKDVDSTPYSMATTDDLAETADAVRAIGGRILTAIADVRSQGQLDEVVSRGLEEFGRIDILLADAGIWATGPFWELDEQQWSEMIDTNLSGGTREEFLQGSKAWHALRGRGALDPQLMADAALWPVSDQAQVITGVALPVDAGHLLLTGINFDPK